LNCANMWASTAARQRMWPKGPKMGKAKKPPGKGDATGEGPEAPEEGEGGEEEEEGPEGGATRRRRRARGTGGPRTFPPCVPVKGRGDTAAHSAWEATYA